MQTQLVIAASVGYGTEKALKDVEEQAFLVGRKLNGLASHLRETLSAGAKPRIAN